MFIVKITELPINFIPQSVSCVALTFPIEGVSELDFSHYKISLPERFEDMAAKRRCEYLAGRLCSMMALKRIDMHGQVDRSSSGCPAWPDGIVGSISHTDSLAISCIATTNTSKALGLDVETFLSDSLAKELAPQILTELDKKHLNVLPFNQFVTLIFSAKEALYKALYPSVGVFFGFEAASLIALDDAIAVFEIQQNLSKEWQKGATVKVKYTKTESMIYTLVHL